MNHINYLIYKLKEKSGELGIETILGIALTIIVAGFILVPGLRGFAKSVLDGMTSWWDNTVKSGIFPTS